MKRINSVLRTFILLLVIALFIEIATRVFFVITNRKIDSYRNFSFNREPKIYMSDPVLGYRLLPNVSRNAFTSDFTVTYKTNSMGLREKELENSTKFKILFLGDSLTFGEGIPYGSRFSDLIEKEMKNVYSINAGVPGYGIHQMYSWLERYGVNLKPDLVVCSIITPCLFWSMDKDVENSPHLFLPKREKKYPKNRGTYLIGRFNKIADQILSKSYFYSVLKVNIQIVRMLFVLKERDEKVWDKIRENYGRLHKIANEEKKEIVKKESSRVFLGLKNICDRAHIKLLVVNIFTDPIPWLNIFLRENGIEYLDLSPRLSEVSKTIRFSIDLHYNSNGNKIIAGLIKKHLMNRYKEDLDTFSE